MEVRIGVLIALEKRDDRKVVWVRVLQLPPWKRPEWSRNLFAKQARCKAFRVRVPTFPPMDARIGALNRLESGDGRKAVGVRVP
jgi:hypothetical protein